MQRYTISRRTKQPTQRPARRIGLGFATDIATAAGVMLSRKAMTAAKVGQGHPLKHRVLDFAAGIQVETGRLARGDGPAAAVVVLGEGAQGSVGVLDFPRR